MIWKRHSLFLMVFPLDAMARVVEINVLELLGEKICQSQSGEISYDVKWSRKGIVTVFHSGVGWNPG